MKNIISQKKFVDIINKIGLFVFNDYFYSSHINYINYIIKSIYD